MEAGGIGVKSGCVSALDAGPVESTTRFVAFRSRPTVHIEGTRVSVSSIEVEGSFDGFSIVAVPWIQPTDTDSIE